MSPTTILRLAVRSTRPQARALRLAPTSQLRPLSQTPFLTFPKKGAEDRESINTESSEHTKSSTDAAAAQLDEAYDPKKTSPESEMESTDGEGSGNPLDVSGANKDVSKQRHPQEGGAEKSPKEESFSRSGAGSPKKGKEV